MMRVVLFGSGAMACLFGARLAAVADVTLVDTWAEAIEAIRKQGILFEYPGGTRSVKVRAQYPDDVPVSADLAIVVVKSWQTKGVAQKLEKYLAADGLAISLQNGLGNVELLGERAFAGSTGEGATLLGPGHVRAGGSGQTFAVAPDRVIELLQRAGFESHKCSKEQADSLLWGKLCINCGINALTAILGVKNGELLKMPDICGLMIRAAAECADVALAKGICLPFQDPAARVKEVAGKTSDNKSSMYQDILRGAPTECDAIYGAVVREAELQGVEVPVNRILWILIRALVKRRGSR